ncbi:5-methylcytosine-specific restriction endonuclease McrA [Halomicrobium zhouii]|uniref:5-methylcytosine-specific restriction endonuclease McrA n=1 Tax=Halomicrobium zhouii TaxID=767519 RepID=A0A1I6K9C9_9EURY|nr:HNH endonuclease signature motif containing protein [Halomicrobium zhouii]SFR87832.1 5-methylcytosine-specific restriction endonuclease McrA [Halomicrobium zhouii]
MAEHTCPTCGDQFDSRRGLGVHHSASHDERLPNRECEECGVSFYSDYAKKYCSSECHDRAVSYDGENNPNYRGGKETTACEICGADFEYYPSEKPGKFCSTCVESESWRTTPHLEGDANPRWKGGKRQYTCDVCDVSFERYPSGVYGEATLCCRDCLAEWISEEFTGEGHPNWRGGGNEAYGSGWDQVRSQALERDEYACVICGADAETLGRNPDVHHIIPVRVFVESPVFSMADAHTLDNVVSLCIACHRRAEFGHYSRAELRWRAGVLRERRERRAR